jgi:hypothetical protein
LKAVSSSIENNAPRALRASAIDRREPEEVLILFRNRIKKA